MTRHVYRYTFNASVHADDIEAALVLSIVSVESLHGESQARMDIEHFLDVERGLCVIDASTDSGRDLNRLFVGYLRREFGEDAFVISRVDEPVPELPVQGAA